MCKHSKIHEKTHFTFLKVQTTKTLKMLLLIGSIGNFDGFWYFLDNQVP